MYISRLIMRTCLYLGYFFHKITRTGTFGPNRAEFIPRPHEEGQNLLKNSLFRHHVKQFHGSSCSVASVVGVINAILQKDRPLNLTPITQHGILDRVKAAHWKERMGDNGYHGQRGLPLAVLAQVVKASLDAYAINYKSVETVQAEKPGRLSRSIRETLVSRLEQFENQGNCLIIAHFDQGSFVQDLNIPHISPVGGFDLDTGKVTILDVDQSQPLPYKVDFDTFYRGLSTDYNHIFKPFGFGRGGYIFIGL